MILTWNGYRGRTSTLPTFGRSIPALTWRHGVKNQLTSELFSIYSFSLTGQETSPFEFCLRRMHESSVKPSSFEQYDRLIIVHADPCVSPRRRAGAPHARHPWPARSSCFPRLGRGTQESCRANVRHQGRHATVQRGAIMGYVVSVNRVRWPSLRSLYKFWIS